MKKALGIFAVIVIMAGLLVGCTNDDDIDVTTTISQIDTETDIEIEENTQLEVEPEIEEYSYYPVLDKIEKIYIGNDFEPDNQIIFVLNDEERVELRKLMRIDEWVIASDLPLDLSSVSQSEFSIHEGSINEEHGVPQSWAFRKWEEQILISPALPDKDSKKLSYFASADILPNLISFTETLTPFSGE